jgi:hypothetical protein
LDYVSKLVIQSERLQSQQNQIEDLRKNLIDVNTYYNQLQQYQIQQQKQKQQQQQAAQAAYATCNIF